VLVLPTAKEREYYFRGAITAKDGFFVNVRPYRPAAPTINGVTLCATYRRPFSILAEGSSRHIWLPLKKTKYIKQKTEKVKLSLKKDDKLCINRRLNG
jgi:hypothetical protein